MSAESMEWLNQNVLVGFTLKRGNAWHYDAELQGTESNHYEMAIPVEDISRRLFNWQPVECQTLYDFQGSVRKDDGRKHIARSDTGEAMGVFKDGYKPHDYNEWLVDSVANILDTSKHDGLACSSSGLLKGGAIAWVEVSVPENITTPEGVVFRPNLLATTSFDGSTASTFKRTVTDTVCDNTRAAALSEQGQEIRVKHTRNSGLRLNDAREALAIVHTVADEFAAQVAELCATTVTDRQWNDFLNALTPIPEDDGRGKTVAQNKQDELRALYRSDPRVAPWAGTAHGVMQAVNTYEHHFKTVRGTNRSERNILNAISGSTEQLDRDTFQLLSKTLNPVLSVAI